MVRDIREELVETCANILGILLNYSTHPLSRPSVNVTSMFSDDEDVSPAVQIQRETGLSNLFIAYLSRLHQAEDLEFLINGLTKLIANPLHQTQTYLPSSTKKIYFTEILYILLWKMISFNQKFLSHMLRGSELFDVLVPLLYELLVTRSNPNLIGLLHVGVFILLVLSGERNFGVRLNKPYVNKYPMDLQKFTGTHADLLFLVFHKIITSGLSRIQPLYDCLLTILVNVSPYLKSLSMLTCTRLMHLMESFSTSWFLFAKPSNHYLIFYLLEILNNIIQYQFDGNINLIYTIVRSKSIFYQLASLSEDSCLSVGSAGTRSRPPPHREVIEGDQQVQEYEEEERVELQVHEERSDEEEEVKMKTAASVPEIEPIGEVMLEATEIEPISLATPISEPATPTTESLPQNFVNDDDSAFISAYDLPKEPSKATPTTSKKPVPPPLLSMRNQVAKGNKSLSEPITPSDFKPTPEWV
jgi:hypothetical protein